jgi:SAM-dependent methyltransferase
MKALDRLLQRWRIGKARAFVPTGARVLDIGCSDAALFRDVPGIAAYVGMDPELRASPQDPRMTLVRGFFPADLPPSPRAFDVVTCLAAFEHVPDTDHATFARACFDALVPGGVLVLTVPNPFVDRILDVLTALRLVDGIEIHQHHGYDVRRTGDIFRAAGFDAVAHDTFQLGLNNLFVFRRPGAALAAAQR